MSQRIDFDGREWAAHCQEAWKDDAANPRFPLPLRVAFLAYGNHKANGHATFKQGEVARALAKFDESGSPVLPARQAVYRAIQQAVDYGLLAEGSRALCLIVPNHRIQGGHGNPDAPCRRHTEARRRGLRVVS